MTPKKLAEWEEERKRGRWRFVLAKGVWPCSFLALVIGTYWRFFGGGWPRVKEEWETIAWWVFWGGVVGGYTFGSSVWALSEAAYCKAKEDEARNTAKNPDERI